MLTSLSTYVSGGAGGFRLFAHESRLYCAILSVFDVSAFLFEYILDNTVLHCVECLLSYPYMYAAAMVRCQPSL